MLARPSIVPGKDPVGEVELNTSTRRALAEIIKTSLNSDQANYIAGHVDPGFDLRRESGFGANIAVPHHVAAETVVNYFRDEEDLIRFFEVMINRQGTFVFNSTITIKGKNDFIKLLAKKRWIFDPDLELFFRDPFFADSINFLKTVELIDMRREIDTAPLLQDLSAHVNNLKTVDINWTVTVRAYSMNRALDAMIKALLDLVLLRQDLQEHAYPLYCCIRELAVNATKANYKQLHRQMRSTPGEDYSSELQAFIQEIEEHGDKNLEQEARRQDLYFDLVFKSSENSLSLWAINFIPLLRVEKMRILNKLQLKDFGQDSFGGQDDHQEGAGLGLNLVKKILLNYHSSNDPVKVVFYPESTKVGFVIRREHLRSDYARAAAMDGGAV